MKRKIIALVGALVVTLSVAIPAFGAPAYAPAAGYGYCGGGYNIMWDQNGSFLDREAFEANLDKMIKDGYVRAEDRDYFLERYDWCANYGGGSYGVRGGGRGMGCGMRRGW